MDIAYSYEYHTTQGVYTRMYIYLQNFHSPIRTRLLPHREDCSLLASHSLAPHTRCQSLAPPHPHSSLPQCHPPPSARRAASSSTWLQLDPHISPPQCTQYTHNTLLLDYMTGRGTANIAVKQLGGCIVLVYSVIAWGILCSRREGSGVAVQATAMRRHL